MFQNKFTSITALLLCLLLITIICSHTTTINGSYPQENLDEEPELIQDINNTAFQAYYILKSTTQQAIQPLLADNFDDNFFDSSIWEKIEVNGGVVSEKSGLMQVTVPDSVISWEDWYWSQQVM